MGESIFFCKKMYYLSVLHFLKQSYKEMLQKNKKIQFIWIVPHHNKVISVHFMLVMLISCCLVCYRSALCVQCLRWVSGMAARKTISWCHVLLGQSDIILSSYADQRRNALWKRQIRLRNVSDGLVLWSQSLKTVWVGFATAWPHRAAKAEGDQLFPSTGNGCKERLLACLTYTLPSSSLTSYTFCCENQNRAKKEKKNMSTERRTTSWAAVEAHVAFIDVIWL